MAENKNYEWHYVISIFFSNWVVLSINCYLNLLSQRKILLYITSPCLSIHCVSKLVFDKKRRQNLHCYVLVWLVNISCRVEIEFPLSMSLSMWCIDNRKNEWSHKYNASHYNNNRQSETHSHLKRSEHVIVSALKQTVSIATQIPAVRHCDNNTARWQQYGPVTTIRPCDNNMAMWQHQSNH